MSIWSTLEDDWNPRLARMERLGASVQELAQETIESIMGYQPVKTDPQGGEPGAGHKPARADIQKMKDAWELHRKTEPANSPYENTPKNAWERDLAQQEFAQQYGLNEREQQMVALYKVFLGGLNTYQPFKGDAQASFQAVIDHYGSDDEAAIKKELGNALKKYEQQNWPMLYSAIGNALDHAYRGGPLESYKLWPRMVSWIKDVFQDWLLHRNGTFNRPNQSPSPISGDLQHIVDVVTEGGAILSKLRAENKLPQNFDVNHLSFDDFENWLMQWKRDNREAESQGEVVYKFHDDWTVQKLTTPEQLQFEGDEMGHCVGGYSDDVGNGEIIIYSLRDPKGQPHVTMELTAQSGIRDDPSPTRAAQYVTEFIHPDKHEPGQHDIPGWVDDEGKQLKSGGEHFEVVQVQGNSNRTPKSEYQHKIKEFLDALRAKGWTFIRSDDWYPPHDEGLDDLQSERIKNAADLDDWYDDDYKSRPERYQKGGEDPYGLMTGRMDVSIVDWGELIVECCATLIDDQDRDRWHTSNWEKLAQAVYHAWFLDTYDTNKTAQGLARAVSDLEKHLEDASDKVQDWTYNMMSYAINEEYREMIADEFKTLAQKAGIWDEIDREVDALFDDPNRVSNYDDELYEIAEEKHPDLFEQARDNVEGKEQEAYAGDAYRFIGYLFNLLHHRGGENPEALPNPKDRHGGLQSYDDLTKANQLKIDGIDKGIPGALSSWRRIANDIQIYPIDQEHNVWFDEDGNQRERWRPGWAKAGEKMQQTGDLEDTFLDKQGRQGEGWVAYHGDRPVGSLTYVDTPVSNMIGTTYVHPEYREQGIFNRLAEPLRSNGKPTDAYVWNNPWLKNKVRDWGQR